MGEKGINRDHLEFIENVIDRMGRNSFQCKTWCFTLVTALVAALFSQSYNESVQTRVMQVVIVALVVFGLLDNYYLYLERGYRRLYNLVAGLEEAKERVKDYDMRIPSSERGVCKYVRTLLSPTTGLCYFVIIILILIAKQLV